MSKRIYPKLISEFLTDNSHYIPKQVRYLSEIKQFAKYISAEQGIGFKIEEIININDQTYYQVRFLDNNRQAVLPYEETFHYYELLTDKIDMRAVKNIINTNIPYYGSEIKYWFFVNNIDLDSEKYLDLKPIILQSYSSISDRKLYLLFGEYKDNIYTACRAEVFKKPII